MLEHGRAAVGFAVPSIRPGSVLLALPAKTQTRGREAARCGRESFCDLPAKRSSWHGPIE